MVLSEFDGREMDWESFYITYKGLFLAVAKKYCSHYQTVEDTVAETFKILIESDIVSREQMAGERLAMYACGIVKNLSRTAARKGGAFVTVSLDELMEKDDPAVKMDSVGADFLWETEAGAEDFDDRMEKVYAAIPRLKEDYQWILRLRFTYLLSYFDIAKLLHISEASARKRVSRALGALRDLCRFQKRKG